MRRVASIGLLSLAIVLGLVGAPAAFASSGSTRASGPLARSGSTPTSGRLARSAVLRSGLAGLTGRGLVRLIFKHACDTPSRGHAGCNAIQVTGSSPSGPSAATTRPLTASPTASLAQPATLPAGYGPADLQSAYKLASAAAANGGGKTVALVDAYDDPNAAADLAVYRSTYGLPVCGTSNGCFRKVNQSGGTSYPAGNVGWTEEISLDLDMVSAICPNCHILLVEASSTSFAGLGSAVNEAASLGATEISNSYGGGEFNGETSYGSSYYEHPGIDVTVSSGDGGYGVEFPAASQYVTAVGGTTLSPSTNARGWTESAWSGAGSGCSVYVPKPAYQTDSAGCPRRTVADVSAVADPNTPVAVYDTYGEGGWLRFGGTSVASPIIASVDALAGGRSPGTTFGGFAYANPGQFFDVVGGSNGSCAGGYQCTGLPGYDGPTGIGSPDGAGVAGPPPPPPAAPVNSIAPTVSGGLTAGQTLSATAGTWSGSPTFAYQWYRCSTAANCASCPASTCTAIGGATGTTYVTTGGDIGSYLTITVTATNAGGSSTATAGPTGPVTPPAGPANTSPPTISGGLTQGQAVSANPGTWSGSPSFTYQWYRCSTAANCASCPSATCTVISGATGTSYTLGAADAGQYVTVTVVGTNAGGSSGVTATPVGPVSSAPVAGFAITASPASKTERRGESAPYELNVVDQNGFKGQVTFGVSGLPAGVSVSLSPNPTSLHSTLQLRSSTSSPAGTFSITVTGVSGNVSATTQISLTLT